MKLLYCRIGIIQTPTLGKFLTVVREVVVETNAPLSYRLDLWSFLAPSSSATQPGRRV